MPAQDASPPQFDRLLATLDMVDVLRRDNENMNQAVDQAEQDKLLEVAVREVFATEGNTVDESIIRQAIAASRKPSDLPFNPMPQGAARSLVNLYIRRDRWLPKTLYSLFAAGLMGLGVFTGNAFLDARFEGQGQEVLKAQAQIAQGIAIADGQLRALNDRPQLQNSAEIALAKAKENHNNALALLGGRPPQDKETLAKTQDLSETAQVELAKLAGIQAQANRLDALQDQIDAFDRRATKATWPELAAAQSSARAAFTQALDQDDAEGANASLNALRGMQTAQAERERLVQAANGIPAAGATEAARLLSAGEAALLAGNTAGAATAREAIGGLKQQIQQAYTLRIINDPSEKSGVWRYPNDNPSGKNYYLVVDARDATDNPISVRVRNEEDGKIHNVSRFAVRVPEEVYEKVKADKTDNGLVDDDQVGNKTSGELEPRFTVPVAGGYITSW